MNNGIRQTMAVSLLSIGLISPLAAQDKGDAKKLADIEKIGNRDINKGNINFTSFEAESKLGLQAAAEVEREITLNDDADILRYVDRIAQNIAKNSDSKFPITVKIIQSNEVNATALPGGFIYVNTGIIKAVDNEAELAFVIAHLVGHVAARHAMESNSKAAILQIATTPSVILTGGVAGNAIQQVAQTALPVSMSKFSKNAAKEADFLGLEYMYLAGYDPQSAVSFFRMLEKMEASGPKQTSLFDTHPAAKDRMKETETQIQKVLPARENSVMNTSEFDAIRARVRQIRIQ